MKGLFFFLSVAAFSGMLAQAQDITFTNRTASFTNLEGRVYSKVELLKADLDGIIWRDNGGGGRVCYTNLTPDFLTSLGIPVERIDIARDRAQHKAVADARYRAAIAAQAQAQARIKAKEEAQERANAPAREREAQRQADLAKIQALSAQIEASERQLNHTVAAVRDTNRAENYANDYYVIGENTLREQIEDAKKLRSKMEDEYAKKYGSR